MFDHEIRHLNARDDRVRLDQLERDIWHKEWSFQTAAAANRRLASWQALVLSIAVAAAGLMGAVTAAQAVPNTTGWFTASVRLAPATLLLGTKQ